MTLPIFDATTACRSHFERLRRSKWHNGDAQLAAWLQRQSIEFNLWSHCSGALAKGRYSLDGKLCLRRPLQSTISNLLWILDSLLADETQLAHQLQTEARQDVEKTLADIVTLTATVREALPFSGIWNPDESNMNISRLLQLREDIEVDDSDYMYELSDKPAFDLSDSDRWASTPRRTASSLSRRSSATSQSQSQQISDRLKQADAKRRSRFELARRRWEQRGRPQPAEIPTAWPPRSQRMLPAVPIVPASSSTFVCPYCYDRLPAYFAEAHAWREHIISDLAPYTCVLPNCLQPSRLFARKTEWMHHMLNDPHGDTKHAQRWRCPMCKEPLDDYQSCVRHLDHEHGSELEKFGITASMPAQLFPEPTLETGLLATCPVCPLNSELGDTESYTSDSAERSTPFQPKGRNADEDKSDERTREELMNHVAWCMEVRALKAINSPDRAVVKSSIGKCATLGQSIVVTGFLVQPSGPQADVSSLLLSAANIPTDDSRHFISGFLKILNSTASQTNLSYQSILLYAQEYNTNELLRVGLADPDAHKWIARETISFLRHGLAHGAPRARRQIAATRKGNVSPRVSDDQSSPFVKHDQHLGPSMYDQSSALKRMTKEVNSSGGWVEDLISRGDQWERSIISTPWRLGTTLHSNYPLASQWELRWSQSADSPSGNPSGWGSRSLENPQ